jgi:Tfp pilus assembly protein PilZ
MNEKRKYSRISSRILVHIQGDKTTTINVSRNGVFLEDISERAINSLVKFKMVVPPDNRTIEIFGKVVRQGEFSGKQGVGVLFHTLSNEDRKIWLEYITLVEKLDLSDPTQEVPKNAAVTGKPDRRKSASMPSYVIRHRTLARLEQFVVEDIAAGSMFLKTPVLKDIGTEVVVVLVHPGGDQDFELRAQVIGINPSPTEDNPKGMVLQFLPLKDETKALLEDFLGMPLPSSPVV